MDKIKNYVNARLANDGSGHDYYHALRTRNNAIKIARRQDKQYNERVVEASALLHDTIDKKIIGDSDIVKQVVLGEILELLRNENFTTNEIAKVFDIIENMSFSNNHTFDYVEGRIVQDADLLESVGLIGVSRSFMYVGNKGDGDLLNNVKYYHTRLSEVINRFNIKECNELYSREFEKTKNFFLTLEKDLGDE